MVKFQTTLFDADLQALKSHNAISLVASPIWLRSSTFRNRICRLFLMIISRVGTRLPDRWHPIDNLLSNLLLTALRSRLYATDQDGLMLASGLQVSAPRRSLAGPGFGPFSLVLVRLQLVLGSTGVWATFSFRRKYPSQNRSSTMIKSKATRLSG